MEHPTILSCLSSICIHILPLRFTSAISTFCFQARNQEPVGGASRFTQKVCDLCNDKEIVVLFSGDAFNPSQSLQFQSP